MNSKSFLYALATLIVCTSIPALAEVSSAGVEVIPKPTPVVPTTATKTPVAQVYQNSSEHMRMDKNWTVSGQVLGAGPTGLGGQGLNIGYHFDRNKLLQLEYTSGNSVNGLSFWTSSYYQIKGSSVGLHYKNFVSNTFYFKLGADHKKVQYDYSYDSLFSSSSYSTSFAGNATVFSIAIGNQWQWDSFTLGCDWFGYSSPIAHSVTSESFSDTTESYQRKFHEDDKKRFLEGGIAQALRFYIGTSF